MQFSLRKVSLRTSGFTLIELMVVVGIAGILLAVGVPSLKDFMAHSKMSETNNALVYSLQMARSASMERLEPAGVCVSSSSMDDDAECTPGASYNEGWMVYVDSNGNGNRDADEDVLERTEAAGVEFAFTPSASFTDQIYFNDSGASVNVAGIPMSGTIGVDYSNGIQVRKITVSSNGRIKTETP